MRLFQCKEILGVKSPQDNLCRGFFIFLCQCADHRLLKQNRFIWMFPGPVGRAQRAVGGHHQAPFPAVGQQLYLGQVGVALYLANQKTQSYKVICSFPNVLL